MKKTEKPDLSAQYDHLRRLIVIARKVRNLTQREVAKRIGQPPSFVAKIETGRRLDVIEYIAVVKAIGVSPHRILAKLLKRWPESKPPTEPPPLD
jgi:transcriptional regulator with XRE-family HTH domain